MKHTRDRSYCNNRPESCFSCPYDDCRCLDKCTTLETTFMTCGIGQPERHRRSKKDKDSMGGEKNESDIL